MKYLQKFSNGHNSVNIWWTVTLKIMCAAPHHGLTKNKVSGRSDVNCWRS